jgi:hypothetical protein
MAETDSFEIAVPQAHRRRLNDDDNNNNDDNNDDNGDSRADVDDESTTVDSDDDERRRRGRGTARQAAIEFPPELNFVEDDGKPLLLDPDLAPETTHLEPAF